MPSNWYFASLGVSYLPEWLHTTANLNIAILQTVKVAAEAIAHSLYLVLQFDLKCKPWFLKNLAAFFTNWLDYVLNFQPKLNLSINEQKFHSGTPDQIFQHGLKFSMSSKSSTRVIYIRKPFLFARAFIFLT